MRYYVLYISPFLSRFFSLILLLYPLNMVLLTDTTICGNFNRHVKQFTSPMLRCPERYFLEEKKASMQCNIITIKQRYNNHTIICGLCIIESIRSGTVNSSPYKEWKRVIHERVYNVHDRAVLTLLFIWVLKCMWIKANKKVLESALFFFKKCRNCVVYRHFWIFWCRNFTDTFLIFTQKCR